MENVIIFPAEEKPINSVQDFYLKHYFIGLQKKRFPLHNKIGEIFPNVGKDVVSQTDNYYLKKKVERGVVLADPLDIKNIRNEKNIKTFPGVQKPEIKKDNKINETILRNEQNILIRESIQELETNNSKLKDNEEVEMIPLSIRNKSNLKRNILK